MADSSEFTSFISRADEEILNALSIADEIRKDTNSSLKQLNDLKYQKNQMDNICVDLERLLTSVSNSSEQNPSFLYRSEDSSELQNLQKSVAVEYFAASELSALETMCRLLIERKQFLQEYNRTLLKDATADDILSETILSERLDEINDVVMHILTIVERQNNIKQEFQDKPLKSTLKVDPACQKEVVRFFAEASELMKKLKENADYIKDYGKQSISEVSSANEALLKSRIQEVTVEFAKRIDIISNFRKELSSSEPETCHESSLDCHSDAVSYYPKSFSSSGSSSDTKSSSDSASNFLSFK